MTLDKSKFDLDKSKNIEESLLQFVEELKDESEMTEKQRNIAGFDQAVCDQRLSRQLYGGNRQGSRSGGGDDFSPL